MAVHFRCPCGAVLNAPPHSAMRAGECPTCGKIVVVPEGAVAVINVPRLTPRGGFPSVQPAQAAQPAPAGGVQVAAPDQGVAAVADDIPDAFPEPADAAAAELLVEDEVAEEGIVADDGVEGAEGADDAVFEADVGGEDDLPVMEAVEEGEPVVDAEVTGAAADEEPALEAEAFAADDGDEAEAELEAVAEDEPEPVEEEPVEKPARPKRTTSRMDRAGKSGRARTAAGDGASEKRSKRAGRVGRSGRHTGRTQPCASCGEPVPVGARKCRACGEPVKAKGGMGKVIVILLVLVVVAVVGVAGVYFVKPGLLPAAVHGPLDGILGGGAAEGEKKDEPAKEAADGDAAADTKAGGEVVDAAADADADADDSDAPTSARDTKIPGMDNALDVDVPTLDFDETPATPAPAGDGESIEM